MITLTFIKLLLNHVKSDSDDASNVLRTGSLFSLTVHILQCHSHNLQYLDLKGRKKGHIDVY